MTPRGHPVTRLALGYLGLTSALVGVWAQILPRAFYDHFPGVGVWVAGDGPFNEHLVRDVGGLNLSLVVLTWWAWRRPERVDPRVAGWATLMSAVPHLAYHSGHLHTLSTRTDQISSLTGLLLSVVCAAALLRPPAARLS